MAAWAACVLWGHIPCTYMPQRQCPLGNRLGARAKAKGESAAHRKTTLWRCGCAPGEQYTLPARRGSGNATQWGRGGGCICCVGSRRVRFGFGIPKPDRAGRNRLARLPRHICSLQPPPPPPMPLTKSSRSAHLNLNTCVSARLCARTVHHGTVFLFPCARSQYALRPHITPKANPQTPNSKPLRPTR